MSLCCGPWATLPWRHGAELSRIFFRQNEAVVSDIFLSVIGGWAVTRNALPGQARPNEHLCTWYSLSLTFTRSPLSQVIDSDETYLADIKGEVEIDRVIY